MVATALAIICTICLIVTALKPYTVTDGPQMSVADHAPRVAAVN